MRRQIIKKPFFLFLTLSVFFHLGFFLALEYFGQIQFLAALRPSHSIEFEDKTKDLYTQIELIESEDERLQLVEQKIQNPQDKAPKEAKFLSKNNQKVEKETQAKRTGKFNESDSQNPYSAPTQASPSILQKPNPQQLAKQPPPQARPKTASTQTPTKNNPLGLLGIEENWTQPQFKPKQLTSGLQAPGSAGSPNLGPSQSEDFLPDTEKGSSTRLNSKKFVYYGYFMRIRDQLRGHWNPKVRYKVRLLHRQGRQVALESDKMTSVRVTLDPGGFVKKIELLKSSGIPDFDDAALTAFRDASPFPNPPKGLSKDTKIQFFWDFVVQGAG